MSPPARPARRVGLTELIEELQADSPDPLTTVVLGGGCAGLALGTVLADAGRKVVVVEARRDDRDGRTWCYWDTGEAVLPEAVSRSWTRWEVRTTSGRTIATDPAHPYRMVRAHDYRVAARSRITGSGRILDGVRVDVEPDAVRSADTPGPDASGAGSGPEGAAVRIVDARGGGATGATPPGRVLLHQRFVGQWIRAVRPVFEDSTVTLMDFPDGGPDEDVRFFYVLPVAPDLALVECTVLSRHAHGREPFRGSIAGYVAERWGLLPTEWTVAGEEAGSIPMTDAAPERGGGGVERIGLRAGIARPSTGYAYTRIQVAARRAAAAIASGDAVPVPRDPTRIRVLDAIFLRFLRDQPGSAPAVFLRMFARLPGPLTVRFLTERSSPLDELRLILALPKAPFLRAALTTCLECVRRYGR